MVKLIFSVAAVVEEGTGSNDDFPVSTEVELSDGKRIIVPSYVLAGNNAATVSAQVNTIVNKFVAGIDDADFAG